MTAGRALLIGAALGCGAAEPGGPRDAAPDVPVGLAPLTWRDHGDWPVGADGLTAELVIDVPEGARSLLVRVRPAQGEAPTGVCFAFGAVEGPSGASAVVPTGPTSDEPDDQAGYALGLWPRLGDSPSVVGTWQLRGALVSCGAGAPVGPEALDGRALVIESVALPRLEGERHLRVRRVYAPDLDAAAITAWDGAFTRAWAAFEAIGVTIDEAEPLHLDPPTPPVSPLRIGVGQTDVDALATVIDAYAPAEPDPSSVGEDDPALVVVVPCLDRVLPGGGQARLSGHATRLPGGPRLSGHASFALVGTATCAPPRPEEMDALGRIIAHELGHLLGLPHGSPPSLMTPSPDTLPETPHFTQDEARALEASPLVGQSPR